ncbi:MAG: hypothetical protein ACI9N9_000002 [Enterobacterales bacterium]|jgi:hypothetical protein
MDYYKSIKDIPQWNWANCASQSDLRYCRVDFNPDGEGVEDEGEQDNATYELIRDQYVSYFGLNPDAIKLSNLQNELISRKLELMITGKAVIQNYINRLEFELSEMLEDTTTVSDKDIDKNWLNVISKTNFPLDTRLVSAYSYRLIIENHNEEIKRQNAAIKKQKDGGK